MNIQSTYTPPTPAALRQLQQKLGLSGKQMAKLAHVSEQHWRKYTTDGENSRQMTYNTLFHLVASLELPAEDLNVVRHAMGQITDIGHHEPTLMDECTAFQVMGRQARRDNLNIRPDQQDFGHPARTAAWLTGWYTEDLRQTQRAYEAQAT
ncbi:Uncharacterised protein [Achromobacter sp. 2789STDY5608615]|uniref:helix-turn-helix domain-containing protein n=1 Tax=Achromobacter sp. 2789STDY5608615 TaxID=1806492 RepID=UPI0006C24138|nr:helix-turn-helix transcriptional regulator [Achromobacter sp. 2789STDY5608615]CUJ82274.1 Uncharacterised protein [Achromobacter sp. 2789STDY5608615]